MTSKWLVAALLFSVAVNVAVMGTLVYFRQTEKQPTHFSLRRESLPHNPDFLWFEGSQINPDLVREMDSLRQQYGEQLKNVHRTIDQKRSAIVLQLQQEPINRDSLNKLISRLTEDQVRAERLTVDHLLAIKPFLPKDEWQMIIRELESPPRMIKTITIEKDSALTHFRKNQEIKEIKIFKHRQK